MSTLLNDRRRIALVALVVATLIAVVWTFWPQPDPKAPHIPVAQVVEPASVLKPAECGRPPAKPFRPTRISVAGVAKNAEVLALGRDGNNVPRAADLTAAGKTQISWDDPSKATAGINDPLKPPGALPGEPQGNVLINAHTWPDGQPPALGNLFLKNLRVGDKIIVKGKDAKLCYKVTKKVVIKAADGSIDYYRDNGPPQLALIVCSAPRLGPGNWENRTIWFASPVVG